MPKAQGTRHLQRRRSRRGLRSIQIQTVTNLQMIKSQISRPWKGDRFIMDCAPSREAEAVFKHIDTNADGQLDPCELQSRLSDFGVEVCYCAFWPLLLD
jgi:hypothetical protein